MTVTLFNTIIFTPTEDGDGKEFKVLFNGTKKTFTELLEEYMTNETIFRPVKFKIFIQNKGHRLLYEVI